MIQDLTDQYIVTILSQCDIYGRYVLEIGCGKGRITRDLAKHAKRIVASDPDAAALEPGWRVCHEIIRGRGICSRTVAQVALTGDPTVEIPCMGDRRFAVAQDHELIVGIPFEWLERAAKGLEATHKAGIRYPIPFQIPSECELPHDYVTSEQDTQLN